MSEATSIWNQLEARLSDVHACLGFDGCVDSLFQVVNKRTGRGDAYAPCPTMTEFSERIGKAAGISCNIEIVGKQVKLGGNGPIMANALAQNKINVTYLGPVGERHINPVFENLAKTAELISLGDPASTSAMEFDDGKVMLANTTIYDEITADHIINRVGKERLESIFAKSRLIAPLNWACIPGLSEVLQALQPLLPNASTEEPRHYFFDLADLARRDDEDIREVLKIIEAYSEFGVVTLGLNLGEALDVLRVHGQEQPEELLEATIKLHELLPRIGITVHATRNAAYAGSEGSAIIEGPYCPKPVTTTGAGDHFNAGFAIGLVCGLPPEAKLKLGVLFSGYYVCKGITPTFEAARIFAAEREFKI